ncbi:hypothetical protein IWT25_00732 [Secundilactobacillus pentosiphilus]|uniref:Uncharacterized protein n=1 Tax=Secundilactobacillus pentosiphilus TaxID=1714682 RepID=A0A1Z5IUZ1_9LACO|nr:hypothetical protein [Secundilactobacillus pentosiphilus]GAX05428.1 hypothetical protein IWT25_00732 [Secundilactobacillus pentosiphilus]
MKTSEFIKKVEQLGFYVIVQDDAVYVMISRFNKHWIMRIGNDFCGYIQADFNEVEWKYDFKALYELAVDYAFTPIKERGDEAKFYVRLSPQNIYDNCSWLSPLGNWVTNQNQLQPGIFTPTSYSAFLNAFPEWQPFLPDYDSENRDVFVPVEDD